MWWASWWLFPEGNWKEYGWIKCCWSKHREKTKIHASMIRSLIFLLQILANIVVVFHELYFKREKGRELQLQTIYLYIRLTFLVFIYLFKILFIETKKQKNNSLISLTLYLPPFFWQTTSLWVWYVCMYVCLCWIMLYTYTTVSLSHWCIRLFTYLDYCR